jgi:hypothetical protein
MTWMQKFLGFSIHVVYHSMFFTHPIGMKWYKPSMVPLKDIGAPHMTKLKPWDLTRKEPKSNSLTKFTNDSNQYGVSIISNDWTNVKGRPLLNILGVSASGVVFLSTHRYSDHYKIGIHIAKALIKTIQEIGPYNVIQVIPNNVASCKAIGAIIEDRYPIIFWSRCLVHILNLLMHDIVNMKDDDYKWIDALYKRGKKIIKFITNHSMAHYIFHNQSKLEL